MNRANLARPGSVLRWIVLIALVGGTLRAAWQIHEFAAVATPAFVAERFVAGVTRFALGAALLAAALAVLAALLRRLAPGLEPRRATDLALLPVLAVPAVLLADWVNARFLPDLFDPSSLAGNAMLAVLALAAYLASRPIAQGLLYGAPRPLGAGTVLVVAALVLANAVGVMVAPAAMPPPVILVVIDALRADALGCYGYPLPTSPRIDRFARDAVRFDTAISQSTFTKTSIASLFTARFPYRHGVYLGNARQADGGLLADRLPEGLTTVAEALQERGLLTAAWVRNPHLLAYMGFSQGFQRYEDQHRPSLGGWQVRRIREALRGRPLDHEPGEALALTRRLGAFVTDTAGHQPFFAYLHVLDLHAPYRPRPGYAELFGGSAAPAGTDQPAGWNVYKRRVQEGEHVPDDAELASLRARYDALIRQLDDAVGDLFDDLRRLGVYDRSLIVVTADHGEGFLEHGFVSHSNLPFDELIRVPLLVKLPGNRHAGRVVRNPVRLVDVAPTLLEAVGAPPLPDADGTSLLTLLDDPDPDTAPFEIAYSEFVDSVAVRTAQWKLIESRYRKPRLYDLASDPGEHHDLAEQRPEVLATLRRALPPRPTADQQPPPPRVAVDAETAEALRALGYLD